VVQKPRCSKIHRLSNNVIHNRHVSLRASTMRSNALNTQVNALNTHVNTLTDENALPRGEHAC
jgi:hypothetical protein